MRTINFTEQDIKDCKLALANQNLTSLQSAFLGQYINNLEFQLQEKENIIKEVKSQLDYLETYSSKEDVFEDMKRRLDKIEKIIDKENK